MREKERELARAWGASTAAPTSRELLHIANAATLQSRKGKDAAAIDGTPARRWATLGGDLAGSRPRCRTRAAPAQAGEHHGPGAVRPPREAQARALAKALVLVPGSTRLDRHDLLKQLLVLPAETRQMSPEEARSCSFGWPRGPVGRRRGCAWRPPSGRRSRRRAPQSDGRSVYSRPGRAVRHRRATVAGGTAGRAGRHKTRRACAASWPRHVLAQISRSYARHWPAARTTRANITRRAGCGWTRRPQPGTRSPRLAPSK